MERATIELRGVGCTIGGRALIKDVNWKIEPGSRWVVFGSNGCGKTTLLSLIAGYGKYNGSLKIDGTELNDIDVDSIVRGVVESIGYTSDDFGFNASTCAVANYIHSQSPDVGWEIRQTPDLFECYGKSKGPS